MRSGRDIQIQTALVGALADFTAYHHELNYVTGLIAGRSIIIPNYRLFPV